MCFGGGGSKPTPAPTPTQAPKPPLTIPTPDEQERKRKKQFDWWDLPKTTEPILSLNPLATRQPQTEDQLRNMGRSSLTISVRQSRSGVGIPGRWYP